IRQKLGELKFKMTFVSEKKQLLHAVKVRIPDVILLDCDSNEDITDTVALIRAFEINQVVDDLVPILGFGSANLLTRGASIYEVGLDDYVEVSNQHKSFSSSIKYWATLH